MDPLHNLYLQRCRHQGALGASAPPDFETHTYTMLVGMVTKMRSIPSSPHFPKCVYVPDLVTSKPVLKDIWLGMDIVSCNSLQSLQERMDKIMSPHNIGRIPQKIASNFGRFTGNQ